MAVGGGARWRHLARRGKDLLLCGKNLAIEPCYKVTTETVKGKQYYVGVRFGHAQIENATWHGVYNVGTGVVDKYLATYTLQRLAIIGSVNSDFGKKVLSGKENRYESGDAVRATIRVTYKFSGSGTPAHPNAKPSDVTYTEDFGKVYEGFASVVIPGVSSGAVVVERQDVGDSSVYVKTSEGSVGYIKKYDSSTGESVNIISIAPPNVSIWAEETEETYTDYTPVDDDDNY